MSSKAPYRVFASGTALLLAVTGLGFRLAFLHLGSHEETRARFTRSRSYERKILAGRGAIYDRNGNGNVLAMNLGVKDICIDPSITSQGESVIKTACTLSALLDVPTDEVVVRMKQAPRRFASIKRSVPNELADEVAALGIKGLFFKDATIRHYPQKDFLCHVLGFVNDVGSGSAGVEQQHDRYLRGSPGIMEGRVNAKREELYIKRGRHVPALEGANVTLTIDQNIQYIVEKALDEVMLEHRAEGAWAVVQRVSTGEILALANRPGFDLNEFRHAPDMAKLNRAIGYVFEPGSTMKPMVIAAALEEKTVTPETMFDCENGAWMYCRRILHDYHPYSRLSVADGLKKSSNILTAKVALTLGDEGLDRHLRAFGFGRKLGFDMPGESLGRNQTGATAAGPVWAAYMKEIHSDLPPKEFIRPESGLIERKVCAISGKLLTDACSQGSIDEIFLTGTQPEEFCDYHIKKQLRDERLVTRLKDRLLVEDLDVGFDLNLPRIDLGLPPESNQQNTERTTVRASEGNPLLD